ncbi:Sua5/YciO/YrdC/YwlC family protein [Patescibacteria group bacterium]|nr:Sua5/YciO/YrdC/YwlC family protein [Patescibacteria group bacterium]MCL5409898.1 Sua5/YciO/YrdC/YwlC family protein [Patescibacteria group bacterium]
MERSEGRGVGQEPTIGAHNSDNEKIKPATGLVSFPLLWFSRNRDFFLNPYKLNDIHKAAGFLAEGEVIAIRLAGAWGLVADGTCANAIDKIFELKRRDRNTPLIIGGSFQTRVRLVDHERLPKWYQLADIAKYDLPHFLEFPVKDIPDGVGRYTDEKGRTAAIYWANYDQPVISLEGTLLNENLDSFLVGSSANIHGEPSARTVEDVDRFFGRPRQGVSCIIAGSNDELPWYGSQIILHFEGEEKVEPEKNRKGSITLASYSKVYNADQERLVIPEDWQESPTAVFADVDEIRKNRSYYRDRKSLRRYA